MKRAVFTALAAAFFCTAASAQHLALGERIPKIKTQKWLDDIVPQQTEYTYIEFVRSTTAPCIASFLKIKEYVTDRDIPFGVVFVVCDEPSQTDPRLRECLGGNVGALIDDTGRIFKDFGVRYVPFGVVIDRKRRAVWFGNPITVDDDFFSKLTER